MQVRINSLQNIRVQSETYPDVWYRVDGLEATCTCKGYRGWGYCKHRRRAQEALKEAGIDHQIPMDEKVEELTEPPKMPEHLPKLYTARFLATDVLMSGVVEPVRVSMFPPKMELPYEIEHTAWDLRPIKSMIGEWPQFSGGYFEKMDKAGITLFADRLDKIAQSADNKPLALLCYEDLTRGHQCHRHVFGVWWEEQTGDPVYELTDDGEMLHPLSIHKKVMPARSKR